MTSPIVIALIAAAITIALYCACGRIGNKYAKGAAQLITVISGVVISGGLSADNSVAAMSGQYFFYIVVAFAILAKFFGRKKPTDTEA
jgi:hypothetical protein